MIRKRNKKELTFRSLLSNTTLPRLEAEMLLAYLAKSTREYLLSHPETKTSHLLSYRFYWLEKKRLKGWPIAYLIGSKGFYGRDFIVSPAVLVPRPETEMMIDLILNESETKKAIDFFDIGTGSAAIIISLAAELKNRQSETFHKSSFFAGDISRRALRVAKANAKKFSLSGNIFFKQGNLLKSFIKTLASAVKNNREIIIAANLPYLNPAEMKEPSISREPKKALLSGLDGLNHYRELFRQLADFENDLGQKIPFSLYCEINPEQTNGINEIAEKILPKHHASFVNDLTGKTRFCLIK